MPRTDHVSVNISTVPSDEQGAQVGDEGYARLARQEHTRFVAGLRRLFGTEPPGARLAMKSNPHDFGSYYDTVCYFEVDNRVATEYAFKLENQCPGTWYEMERDLCEGHEPEPGDPAEPEHSTVYCDGTCRPVRPYQSELVEHCVRCENESGGHDGDHVMEGQE